MPNLVGFTMVDPSVVAMYSNTLHSLSEYGNGDAFADDNGPGELARILRKIADRLTQGNGTSGSVCDVNGNACATYALSDGAS